MTLTARLDTGALSPGQTRSITIDVEPGDGWTLDQAGIPGAIVQLDVPGSITLEGRVVESLRDLSRNEFLQEPWERMVQAGTTSIGFTLDEAPAARRDDRHQRHRVRAARRCGGQGDVRIRPPPRRASPSSRGQRHERDSGDALQLGRRAGAADR